jgi:prepilin-type N-terminal cleavage/methylation domain-containing protein/prepilin-type processing-associated H-X9-DG protein
MRLILVHSRAFSLIELLVTIAIIALLVALIMPAVQYAREAARRSQCKNHLHQLGLAMESYHTSQSMLPFGWMCRSDDPACMPNQPRPHMWSGLAMALPELEQSAIFNSINFWLERNDVANSTGVGQAIAVFLCPSHSRSSRVLDSAPLGNGFYVGGSDYKANVGGGAVVESGLMYRNSSIRFAEIRDGDSNTLLLGESSASGSDARWADAAHCCVHTNARLNANPSYWSSMHSGGAHLLMADGSVRFVSENLRVEVLVALATRDGSETISESDF